MEGERKACLGAVSWRENEVPRQAEVERCAQLRNGGARRDAERAVALSHAL